MSREDCSISFGLGPGECKHSQVRWRGKTTHSTSTVLCMVASSIVLLAAPAIAALAECQATESCGGTDDCRVCVDLTYSIQCASREFCEWGKELQVPITAADIVFVVGGLVCELYTTYRLFDFNVGRGSRATFNLGYDGKCTTCGRTEKDHYKHWDGKKYCYGYNILFIFCFLADVGFTVGKLFPTSYLCRSLDCAKITHNCVMTLAGFLFAA